MKTTRAPLRALTALAASAVLFAGCLADSDYGAGDGRITRTDQDALDSIQSHPHRALCGAAKPGFARCHALARTQSDGTTIQAFASPSGLTPSDLQSAYAVPAGGGTGATIAIIDAQDDPNAESDLAVYRSQFGLPACTTANGCFKKINQSGNASPLPSADSGWAGEIALDLDMASAICPKCKILLVEANSSSMADLGAAVNTAATHGATVISNSYGGSEDSSNASSDAQYFNHPGIAITASSGDDGYGVEYPAASAHVIAVGGTSLAKSGSARGWAEGAWNGAGSGCSKYTTKLSGQKDTGCAKRTVADVSAVADPNTGVSVYDTYGGAAADATGWVVYGGTSAASPIVAAVLAASGKGNVDNSFPYANTGDFYDVTSGSNGSCSSSTKYLCTAGAGYDGPTGVGTPNGAAISGGSGGTGGSGGSGGAGGGTTSSTTGTTTSSTTGGGSTCSHSICTSGTKLTKTCDPCATKICAADSYCCSTKWDSQCTSEVSSICGESCSGSGSTGSGTTAATTSTTTGGGSTCSHAICSTGTKLTSSCDSCAAKICASDAYCCSTQWDTVCVGEVSSVCGETCN